jgi:hypothetical protein
MDKLTVCSWSKFVCITGRCVAGYVPIFAPSKTICAVYFTLPDNEKIADIYKQMLKKDNEYKIDK